MKQQPITRTDQILTVMHVLAWITFVGFCIKAGAILISYGVSWKNPAAAGDLYSGLNLFNLRQYNFWHYTLAVSYLAALEVMRAYTAYLVITALSKFKLADPFTAEVAGRLEKISIVAFGTWVVTMIYNAHNWLLVKRTGEVMGEWLSGEFIFLVGIVYIFAQVFKRGVEIQSENEMTV